MDTAALSSRVYAVMLVATLLAAGLFALEIYQDRDLDEARANVRKSLDIERELAELRRLRVLNNLMHRYYLQSGGEQRLQMSTQAIDDAVGFIQSLSSEIKEPAVRMSLDTMEEIGRQFRKISDESIQAYHEGNDSLAFAIYESPLIREIGTMYTRNINRIRNSEAAALDLNRSRVSETLDTARNTRIAGLVILALVIAYLLYCIRRLINTQETLIKDLTKENERRTATELQREALITDLELKNESLDSFAYIASHDLQEPLRTVTNFLSLLKEEFGDKIGEDGEQYFSFINGATTRMKRLITNLLHYSQLGRTEKEDAVDMDALLVEVLEDLQTVIKEKDATITREGMPTMPGYPTELRQLLQNLVLNALKFSRPGVPPVVHITCTENEYRYEMAVIDNGIGITDANQKKIFRMFARVNEPGRFEGQGIGLAFCRKIAELHGGQLTVSSEEGAGSTFTLTVLK